jgi:hypothetical protein
MGGALVAALITARTKLNANVRKIKQMEPSNTQYRQVLIAFLLFSKKWR